MIDKGGKDFDEPLYCCFQNFEQNIITPLVTTLGIGYHQFLFVPGNHEVVRQLKDVTKAPQSDNDKNIDIFFK